MEFWKEGWFTGERNLSDVHEELARRGYHYDRTAVSHALTDLVRENVLTRVGMMRSYRYIQKKPPA
jgi:predicted transcriptional regulator